MVDIENEVMWSDCSRIFVEQSAPKRAVIKDGDVLRFKLTGSRCIFGKVTCRSAMAGFASMMDIYRAIYPLDVGVAALCDQFRPENRLVGPVLFDGDVLRQGLVQKVAKCEVTSDDLDSSFFVNPIAYGDHPLACHFIPEDGSYHLHDRTREGDYTVTWEGTPGKPKHQDGVYRLGKWRTVPNAASLAERLEATLVAQGIVQ